MTASEIQELFSRLPYKHDARRPPDARRRSQFRTGWHDTTVRGEAYRAETLAHLTWRNLGYRLGQHFGPQSPAQIDWAYQVLAEVYEPSTVVADWRTEVRRWLMPRRNMSPELANSVVAFFERAFEHTRCPEHAWFGVHNATVSLVVGGIFLAAVQRLGQDRGFWLLVDQSPPQIEGVEYRPVISTHNTQFPLTWAHAASLAVMPTLVAHDQLWESFASASEQILHVPRVARDRDAVQERRKKQRLSTFWYKEPRHLFPDEIDEVTSLREGAQYQVTVNAYERDPRARRQCIAHYGTRCVICGFSFGAVYGEVAEDFIHVHHVRPLAEVGAEYIVDPVADLRPVCPNCHAVIHLRKPAFSIQEVVALLRHREFA